MVVIFSLDVFLFMFSQNGAHVTTTSYILSPWNQCEDDLNSSGISVNNSAGHMETLFSFLWFTQKSSTVMSFIFIQVVVLC